MESESTNSIIDIIIFASIVIFSIIVPIFNKIFGKKEPVRQKPVVIPQSFEEFFDEGQTAFANHKTLSESMNLNNSKPALTSTPIAENPLLVQTNLSTERTRKITVNLNTTSEWQKAFVYSEIFNRKY